MNRNEFFRVFWGGILVGIILTFLGVWFSRIEEAPKYPKELDNFIGLAKDMFSAIDSGLSYEKYGDLLIELKIAGDRAIEKLDDYPMYKPLIENMLDDFIIARDFWSAKIQSGGHVEIYNGTIDPRFSDLKRYFVNHSSLIKKAMYDSGTGTIYIDTELVLQLFWKEASESFEDLRFYFDLYLGHPSK